MVGMAVIAWIVYATIKAQEGVGDIKLTLIVLGFWALSYLIFRFWFAPVNAQVEPTDYDEVRFENQRRLEAAGWEPERIELHRRVQHLTSANERLQFLLKVMFWVGVALFFQLVMQNTFHINFMQYLSCSGRGVANSECGFD